MGSDFKLPPVDGVRHSVLLSGHDRRNCEAHRAETYAQQGQRSTDQGQRCTLRERSDLETLAGLLAPALPMLQKDNE